MAPAVGTVVAAGRLSPVYGAAEGVPAYSPVSPTVHDDGGDDTRV